MRRRAEKGTRKSEIRSEEERSGGRMVANQEVTRRPKENRRRATRCSEVGRLCLRDQSRAWHHSLPWTLKTGFPRGPRLGSIHPRSDRECTCPYGSNPQPFESTPRQQSSRRAWPVAELPGPRLLCECLGASGFRLTDHWTVATGIGTAPWLPT